MQIFSHHLAVFSDWNGFVLDKRQLIPTARETFEGVKVVIDKIIEEHKFDPRKSIFNDYR